VTIQVRPTVIHELTETRKLGFLSCGWELQTECANRLIDLIEDTHRLRCEATASMDEGGANRCYLELEIFYACQRFLCMWIFAKKDDMNRAWEAMVDTQATIEGILKIQSITEVIDFDSHVRVCEQILFRPQTYTSASVRFSRGECSICKGEYGECGHVAGRLYMGQICVLLPRGDVSIEHQSIVKIPKDKCCRVLRFQRGTKMVDSLTMRVSSEADSPAEKGTKIEMLCLRAGRRSRVFRFQKSGQISDAYE
jgi:hypothetical protein